LNWLKANRDSLLIVFALVFVVSAVLGLIVLFADDTPDNVYCPLGARECTWIGDPNNNPITNQHCYQDRGRLICNYGERTYP